MSEDKRAGGWFGWRVYAGHRLAVARQACVEASEGYRKAADGYSRLVDGDAAMASSPRSRGSMRRPWTRWRPC